LYFSDTKNKIAPERAMYMRMKLCDILLALVLSIVSPCGVFLIQAQDSSFPGTEVDDLGVDKESEKMMYTPGELDPAFKKSQRGAAPIIKDSTAIKPTIRTTKVQTPDSSKAPAKRPSEEDDSILSFNFLYYIFQKYKMQEVVD
jgi:hypothetical protein